jgi:integrase
MELRSIRPSIVQAWLRGRRESCAASYVKVMLANLSTILDAAVEDGLIARNPCRSSAVKAPAVERDKIVPWTRERVEAVINAHPKRYQALPVVPVACGLRQGEVFGLRVEDVDFLRCATTTPACCSMLVRASGRWRTTSAMPIQGSRCACTRI